MSLIEICQRCEHGTTSSDYFVELAHGIKDVLDIDKDVYLHIRDCKICKRVLKKVMVLFEEEIPCGNNIFLERLDVVVHLVCDFEEICGDFWDEKRHGNVNNYIESCRDFSKKENVYVLNKERGVSLPSQEKDKIAEYLLSMLSPEVMKDSGESVKCCVEKEILSKKDGRIFFV